MTMIDREYLIRTIGNALIMSGITFISLMLYYGYPPQPEYFYVAGLNFGLMFLTLCKGMFTKKTKPEEAEILEPVNPMSEMTYEVGDNGYKKEIMPKSKGMNLWL